MQKLMGFLHRRRRNPSAHDPAAVSLFSGAGLSDLGYALAGFRFCAQVEIRELRAAIGGRNFSESEWITGDVNQSRDDVVRACRRRGVKRLDLLVATPPCQGLSSSNPSRGKRKTPKATVHDEKNSLVLSLVPIAEAMRPRVIVTENVRQIRTHTVSEDGRELRVLDALAERLPEYRFFETTVNVADYGIPQTRYRALAVGVHVDEPWLTCLRAKSKAPWPKPTHAQRPYKGRLPWLTIREWLETCQYPPLSSRSPQEARNGHPLHFVPHYEHDRFLLVNHIPAMSGRSAYENALCPDCGRQPVPLGVAVCDRCGRPMRNRPIVLEKGTPRLVKGFASSYRRMKPDEPSPTVTTNSSHIGSDNKIHPWEDRVLSILECADLQTVPRFFDWSAATEANRMYLVRNLVGEAFPPFFTHLHGRVLLRLLKTCKTAFRGLATYRKCESSRGS